MKKDPKTIKLNLEVLLSGSEPVWNEKGEISFIRALNWYSNNKDPKDSKAYFLDYLRDNKEDKKTISKLSSINEKYFSNIGFLCRMKSRGATLSDVQEKHIIDKLNNLLSFKEELEESVDTVEKVSIQDRMFDQATVYINHIEGYIDEYIKKRSSEFKCYDWLNSTSIKPIYISHIMEHYKPLVDELKSALNKEDEQLQEAYSHWNKKELTAYFNFVSDILKDCSNYSSNVKTVKKPRKKKAVSLDKKTSKMKYKKEDSQYKIVSIDPTLIISASQLWVFNTKTKKLGLYKSKDDSGLSVKGTTVQDFDEVLSVQKTLRKPEDQLKFVLDKKISNKKFSSDFWKSIKTVESPLNGRINEEIVILKAIK